MADIKRYEGTVKWFNGQKGYGFIDPEDGSSDDLFVHQSEIKVKGFRFLRDGQRVEFSVHSGEDGRKKAVDVVGLGRTKRYQPRPRYGGHGIRGSYGRYGGESSDEGHGMRNWRFGRGGRGGGDGVGNPQCYNCGRFGHFARNCYECSDHGGQDYENSSGRGNGRGSGRGRGHSHSRGSDGKSGTCFRCGEEGHFARECPNDQIN